MIVKNSNNPPCGWVPESERDTRWWIWNKLFQCRLNAFKARSIEDVEHFGVPSSGDPLYDQAMMQEEVIRMLTINQMVEYFRHGLKVGVVDVKKTKEIYEHITDHLNAWKEKLEQGWHTRQAPIDDLILMDRFANAVYIHARHHFTTEIVDSILARRMSSTLKRTRSKILGEGPKAQVVNKLDGDEEKDTVPKFPERKSMAETFAAKADIANGGHKWK